MLRFKDHPSSVFSSHAPPSIGAGREVKNAKDGPGPDRRGLLWFVYEWAFQNPLLCNSKITPARDPKQCGGVGSQCTRYKQQ